MSNYLKANQVKRRPRACSDCKNKYPARKLMAGKCWPSCNENLLDKRRSDRTPGFVVADWMKPGTRGVVWGD